MRHRLASLSLLGTCAVVGAIAACDGNDDAGGEQVPPDTTGADAGASRTDASRPDPAPTVPDASPPAQDAAVPTKAYAVGGVVKNLRGTGLTLANGNDTVAVDAADAGDVPFVFPAKVESGKAYSVSVQTPPSAPSQTCTVTGASGTVASADVTNVVVSCEVRRSVTVTSAAPAVLTGFQVPVTLTAANFDYASAKADGADLRISVDGVTLTVPYWIESWNPGGTSKIWVKVPSIPANGTTKLYLHYGDVARNAASNGDNTFELFDDFEDGVFANKWDVYGTPSTLEETGGELHLLGNANWEYVAAKKSFDYPVVMFTEYRTRGISTGFVLANATTRDRYSFRQNGAAIGTTTDPDVSSSNAWLDQAYPGLAWSGGDGNNLVAWKIEVTAGLAANAIESKKWCNVTAGTCNETPKALPVTNVAAFVPGFTSYSAGHEVYVGLFHARKYSAAAVTATVD